MSRTERARLALAYLSRVMRPVPLMPLAAALGESWEAMHSTTMYHPWFSRRGGVVWITEAGWRERLAGHKCMKE